MEDKIFGCECRDYKCADWVSIEEYNRVVKENEQLLEYIRNKKASSTVDKILSEREK